MIYVINSFLGVMVCDIGCCMCLLIRYIIEAVCKYVCVWLGGLYGSDGNENCIKFNTNDVLVAWEPFCYSCVVVRTVDS